MLLVDDDDFIIFVWLYSMSLGDSKLASGNDKARQKEKGPRLLGAWWWVSVGRSGVGVKNAHTAMIDEKEAK